MVLGLQEVLEIGYLLYLLRSPCRSMQRSMIRLMRLGDLVLAQTS